MHVVNKCVFKLSLYLFSLAESYFIFGTLDVSKALRRLGGSLSLALQADKIIDHSQKRKLLKHIIFLRHI